MPNMTQVNQHQMPICRVIDPIPFRIPERDVSCVYYDAAADQQKGGHAAASANPFDL